jgi:hypothetical protein
MNFNDARREMQGYWRELGPLAEKAPLQITDMTNTLVWEVLADMSDAGRKESGMVRAWCALTYEEIVVGRWRAKLDILYSELHRALSIAPRIGVKF